MDEYTAVPAHWYDGISAVRHSGTARWDGGVLVLEPSGEGPALRVAAADLIYCETQRERHIYRRTGAEDFRLILPGEMPANFRAALPAHGQYGGWVDRFGLWKATLSFGVVSAALLAAFLTAPEWLGPRIPSSWERSVGDAMVGDIDRRVCHTPEADAAMAKLLKDLDPGSPKVRAGIANIDMVNAVALPGEHVLLFDGIVQQAKSPEELAGVLAHEVGHVRERHVMTAMMRQFGLSILLAGADSGIVNNASGIAAMGYSRDAEREADQYARTRLASASISPLGAAAFFDRMAKEAGDSDDSALIGWIASHPSSKERARAFREAGKGKAFSPALTAQEFAALKSACRKDKTAESWDLF